MSLCDVCTRPGRCCVGLSLNGGSFPTPGTTALEATVELASCFAPNPDRADRADLGLPFLPFRQHEDGRWQLWCPNLTLEGRCGDYENRPFACSSYRPGQDGLCAMHGRRADRWDGECWLPPPSKRGSLCPMKRNARQIWRERMTKRLHPRTLYQLMTQTIHRELAPLERVKLGADRPLSREELKGLKHQRELRAAQDRGRVRDAGLAGMSPGDALRRICRFERWARRADRLGLDRGRPPAHIASIAAGAVSLGAAA